MCSVHYTLHKTHQVAMCNRRLLIVSQEYFAFYEFIVLCHTNKHQLLLNYVEHSYILVRTYT